MPWAYAVVAIAGAAYSMYSSSKAESAQKKEMEAARDERAAQAAELKKQTVQAPADAEAAARGEKLRRLSSRTQTILTSPQGVMTPGNETTGKTLLGS